MVSEDDGRDAAFFVNREAELEWIARRAGDRAAWGQIIAICGLAGIGKTALVQQFVRARSRWEQATWLSSHRGEIDFDLLDYTLRDAKGPSHRIVVLDDTNLTERDVERTVRRVFNWKAVRMLFLTQRKLIVGDNVALLRLGPLDQRSTMELFRRILGDDGADKIPYSLSNLTEGHPLAIHLVAGLLRTRSYDPANLATLLKGSLYRLEHEILVPRRELISSVRPRLVVANEEDPCSTQGTTGRYPSNRPSEI